MRSRQLTQPPVVISGPTARPRPAKVVRSTAFATLLAARAGRAPGAVASATTSTARQPASGTTTPAPLSGSLPPTVDTDAAGGAGAAIVSAAMTQLGGRYVWGGEQVGAFDCSGLTRWAVRQATGQTMPRVAADQARAGRPVERGALRPGDLVFLENTYGPGSTHVGMYAGDDRFVHAASERQGIVITPSTINTGPTITLAPAGWRASQRPAAM